MPREHHHRLAAAGARAGAPARGQEDVHRDTGGAKQARHTGDPEEGRGRGEQGRGGLSMGGGEPGGKRPGAGRTLLTYFAKKDFCSWGFLPSGPAPSPSAR